MDYGIYGFKDENDRERLGELVASNMGRIRFHLRTLALEMILAWFQIYCKPMLENRQQGSWFMKEHFFKPRISIK